MYQVTFTSLTVPETKQVGITMLRRAARCLAEKMAATINGALPSFDFDSGTGQITVSSESLEALLSLPLSIGSPVGHFGQLERSAAQLRASDRRFRAVYSLKPVFARAYRPDTRKRLTDQISVRLFHYLTAQMAAIEVEPNEDKNEIVVYFDRADQSRFVPEQFNAVFVRSALVEQR